MKDIRKLIFDKTNQSSKTYTERGYRMKILDGKAVALEIQSEIKNAIHGIQGRAPALAVILVGENPASEVYIKHKRRACEEAGIQFVFVKMESTATEDQLIEQINCSNADPAIDGILVQLPLPKQINPLLVMRYIDPKKDVDGFHPMNTGKLLSGDSDAFVPCTPLGIKVLLARSGIETAGKHALILGRSNIVGKPMAALLMQNTQGGNATVTVAHSKTENLTAISQTADIIIAAIGRPRFLTHEMVKEGAVVVDVGINKIINPARSSGYEIVGDVDFENVKDKCSHITPVPGGVGPLTIAMLLANTLASYARRHIKTS